MNLTYLGQKWPLHKAMTPASWYRHLRDERGRVDWEAIALLSVIVARDLQVPDPRLPEGWMTLSCEYIGPRAVSLYSAALGFTRGAIRRAARRLEQHGLITVEVVANQTASAMARRRGNGTYFRPVVERIIEITHP